MVLFVAYLCYCYLSVHFFLLKILTLARHMFLDEMCSSLYYMYNVSIMLNASDNYCNCNDPGFAFDAILI